MTDATADLRTVSWGDPGAPNTALLVHGLTGRQAYFCEQRQILCC